MSFRYSSLVALFCAGISGLGACQSPSSTNATKPLLAFFQVTESTDTIHVEITSQEATTVGDSISNSLFFKDIPSNLLEEIDYIVDSSEAKVFGRQHFSLDDKTEAYWVEIHQFWFQHHSLLLYDKAQKAFTDRVTLAEWYGGESGQILIGSWLFDFDGDGKKDIVQREIEHRLLILEDGTTEDQFEESAKLLLWKNGAFVETPLQDTASVIKRYPIRSMW